MKCSVCGKTVNAEYMYCPHCGSHLNGKEQLQAIIDESFDGDATFPTTEQICWCIIQQESHQPDKKNKFPYQFLTLDRKS